MPEKFKGTFMPIRSTEEKNEESLTMVKALCERMNPSGKFTSKQQEETLHHL